MSPIVPAPTESTAEDPMACSILVAMSAPRFLLNETPSEPAMKMGREATVRREERSAERFEAVSSVDKNGGW